MKLLIFFANLMFSSVIVCAWVYAGKKAIFFFAIILDVQMLYTGCVTWHTIYNDFSILMISVMPSYISLTAWNSVKPMRLLLEIS